MISRSHKEQMPLTSSQAVGKMKWISVNRALRAEPVTVLLPITPTGPQGHHACSRCRAPLLFFLSLWCSSFKSPQTGVSPLSVCSRAIPFGHFPIHSDLFAVCFPLDHKLHENTDGAQLLKAGPAKTCLWALVIGHRELTNA